jgi:hypothetical protein
MDQDRGGEDRERDSKGQQASWQQWQSPPMGAVAAPGHSYDHRPNHRRRARKGLIGDREHQNRRGHHQRGVTRQRHSIGRSSKQGLDEYGDPERHHQDTYSRCPPTQETAS